MEEHNKVLILLAIIAIMGGCFVLAVYDNARTIKELQDELFECNNPYISDSDTPIYIDNISLEGFT